MPFFGKIFNRLTVPCIATLTIGVGFATIAATGFAIYSNSLEEPQEIHASVNVDLPQDQAMLKALSDALSQGVDLAGEETKLDEIAPAAGAPLHGDD